MRSKRTFNLQKLLLRLFDRPRIAWGAICSCGILTAMMAFAFISPSVAFAQNNVGIGTTTPATTSILDLTSTSLGFLVPRMATANRTGIVSPATGLLVYDNTINAFYYYNGTAWVPFLSSAATAAGGWTLLGNAGTSSATNFLGTTDAQDLVFKTNGTEGMRYVNGNGLAIGVTTTTQKLEVAGNVRIDAVAGAASTLAFQNPAATFSTTIKAGAQAAAITYVLPTAQATANQYLKNDGAGNLSWSTVAGGGGTLWQLGGGTLSLQGNGLGNNAGGDYSIAAGSNNDAGGDYSSIIGGYSNQSSGNYSVVAGGQSNQADGTNSSIGGGYSNQATASYSAVSGGQSNQATNTNAFVGGGYSNTASGLYSTVAGGQTNIASATNSTVGGGISNSASAAQSTVAGGNSNTASGTYGFVGGGQSSSATAQYSVAAGGLTSQATGSYSAVLGGQTNTAAGQWSSVLGGLTNQVTSIGSYSSVLGGQSNTVSGSWSLAFGNGANVTQDNSVVFNHPSSGSQTRVGIRTNSPSEALHLLGNILVAPSGGVAGQLKMQNPGGTFQTIIQSGAQAADITYTLPTAQGAASTVLTNNGTGTLSWAAAGGSNWTLTGNAGTTAGTNYIGTSDAVDLRIRTNATDRIAILSTGNVGIGLTAPLHPLHVTSATTTAEVASVYGVNTGSTTNHAIGVWGDASNVTTTNTGTIGVLATGNGNTTAGQTNMALQVNDGEIAMGRTTQTPSVGSVVEGATAGVAYSAQGPSGVLEFTLGAAGNLVTIKPTAGTFQSLGTVTINNRYVNTTSIIHVNVVSKIDEGTAPSPLNAVFITDVTSRAAGSFVMAVGMIPTVTNAANFQAGDKIRIGYTVINGSR